MAVDLTRLWIARPPSRGGCHADRAGATLHRTLEKTRLRVVADRHRRDGHAFSQGPQPPIPQIFISVSDQNLRRLVRAAQVWRSGDSGPVFFHFFGFGSEPEMADAAGPQVGGPAVRDHHVGASLGLEKKI
jgi:hypothetical protein